MGTTRRSATGVGAALACGALVVSALHCGTSGGSLFTDGPCASVLRDQCGRPCVTDEECGPGTHCGLDDRCTAQCAPGSTCADGVPCSPRGRCGSDPVDTSIGEAGALDAPGPDAVCADIDVSLTKIVPKVLFLLDQSSSMYFNKFPSGASNGCNPDCRWTVLKDVLIGPASNPGGLVKQLEGEAELGVEMYSATDPNPNDGDNSLLPPPTDAICPRFNGKAFDGLAFALNNSAAIDALLRPASVDDDTPTGPAIRAVVGLADDGGVVDPKGLASVASSAPKVLVLVTDGEPMLCGQNSPSDPGRAAVVSAVQQTYAKNIRTFVVAIGDTTPQAEAHFKQVANAGQGLDSVTGGAEAIRPSTPQQLVDALRQIVLDARTCSFTLNGQVKAGTESSGTVVLNGVPVPYDTPGAPEEGWRLSSPSQLELVGKACETLKSTPNATLTARFPCGTVLPLPR